MSTHEQISRFSFDGIKTSVERSPAKYVVVASKTGPARTLSLNANTICELRALRGNVPRLFGYYCLILMKYLTKVQ